MAHPPATAEAMLSSFPLYTYIHLLFPLPAMCITLRKLQVAHIATVPTTTQLSTVMTIKTKERRGQPG